MSVSRTSVKGEDKSVNCSQHCSQSCPWVGLTRGLGWVGLGGVGNGSKICVFSGLGWVMGLKWQMCENTWNYVTLRWSTGKFVLWKLAVMLVILWVFALLRCALGWWWWHDVHTLIFLRQASKLLFDVRGFGLGWVGSWVHKFTWQWVGLGRVDENRPTDNSDCNTP